MKHKTPIIIAVITILIISAITIVWKSSSEDSSKQATIHRVAQPPFELSNRATIFVRGHLGKLSCVLPEPTSNMYQDVVYLRSNYDVERLYLAGKVNKYTRRIITNNSLLAKIEKHPTTICDEYYVTPYEIKVNFDNIKTIYPYNTESTIYKRYTAQKLPAVDPSNPFIVEMSNTLWEKSNHDIIKYARLCYEKTATYLEYENKRNMPPLGEVLLRRKGNCVDYSSMFISLLRAKKIPARYVGGLRTNQERHCWAEFYLEQYGWIPVDATYKHSNPDKNYFGYYDGKGVVNCLGLNGSYIMEDNPKITLPAHNWNVYYYSWPKNPKEKVRVVLKHNFNCHRY